MEDKALALVPSEVVSLGVKATEMEEQTLRLVVDSKESAAIAVEVLKGWKALDDSIVAELKEPKKRASEAHAALVAFEKKMREVPTRMKNLLNGRILDFQNAEKKRADDERKRLEAEQLEEQKRRDELANWAEQEGDKEYAAQVRATPVIPLPVPPKKAEPIVAGAGTRTTWKAAVTDMAALVQYVATHPEHINLLNVNQTNADALARLIKNTGTIPGLEFTDKQSLVVGK